MEKGTVHPTVAKQENVPRVARVLNFLGETGNLICVYLLIKNVLFKLKEQTSQTTIRAKHLGLACRVPVCGLCRRMEEIRDNEAGQLKHGKRQDGMH